MTAYYRTPEAEAEKAAALLKEEMESAVQYLLSTADVNRKTWYDAKG